MGEGDQRVDGVEIALIGAEIGLERPEGQQDPRLHAIVTLRTVEDRAVTVVIRAACIHAVLRDQRAREIQKRALEDALAAVRVYDGLFMPDIAEEIVDERPIIAAISRLRAQPVDEAAEIAATALRLRAGTEAKGEDRRKTKKKSHKALIARGFAPR